MRKNALLLLVLCAGLVLSGCGKKTDDSPAGQEAAENTFPEEVVLNESTEESGSIKNENTDEETGEAADEISTECRLEADHDGLIAELGADAEGYTWHYIISDENLMKPESEYMEEREDGTKLYMVEGIYNEDAEEGTDFRAIVEKYVSVGIVANVGQ